VTVCAHNRACLFGDIRKDEMHPNDAGRMVQEEWFRSAKIRREIELWPDEFVVMPNHIHGIVWIHHDCKGDRPVALTGPPPKSLGALMAGFKSITTKRINAWRGAPGQPVWQRNYYEHVIRNDDTLNRIREYIINNPLQWAMDRENPNCAVPDVGATGRSPLPDDEPWRV